METEVIDVFGSGITVQERLQALHTHLKDEFSAITRVAVALYDDATGTLKTFVHSTDGPPPFGRVAEKLDDCPVLAELADQQMDRIITNLADEREIFPQDAGSFRRALVNSGYLSSYTTPFYESGSLLGFVFFDSLQENYFSEQVIDRLSLYRHLISLIIVDFVRQANILRSAVAIARDFGIRRDSYTGAHLDRMAHYSRIIAESLEGAGWFGEDFVDCVVLFAPLHDIGKIAMPDEILLKRGRLTPTEFTMMQRHVSEGVAIVDKIIESFRIGATQHAQTLKNIVRYHHERYDGTGYLEGLAGQAIPIEARIISVADVFDALTAERPYKAAMSNALAFSYLLAGGGTQFDHACVEALVVNRVEVEAIQESFGAEAAGRTA